MADWRPAKPPAASGLGASKPPAASGLRATPGFGAASGLGAASGFGVPSASEPPPRGVLRVRMEESFRAAMHRSSSVLVVWPEIDFATSSVLPFWEAVRSCDALVFLGISAWLDLGIAASGLRSARVVVL